MELFFESYDLLFELYGDIEGDFFGLSTITVVAY